MVSLSVYLLALLLAGFADSAAFLGLPTGATSRILSKSFSVYRASWENGFIPARNSRRLMVSFGSLNLSAISVIVIPFISPIIGILSDFLKNVHENEHLLNVCIVKIEKCLKNVQKYGQLLLTNCSYIRTI